MEIDLEYMADIKWVKDRLQESFYRDRANAIFSLYVRNGAKATEWVADLLHEKAIEGLISQEEFRQVLAADLLWSVEIRRTKTKVVLVVEASWDAATSDIDHALTRAKILQRIGLLALPVVGGHEWDEATRQKAIEQKVISTFDRHIDIASWKQALEALG